MLPTTSIEPGASCFINPPVLSTKILDGIPATIPAHAHPLLDPCPRMSGSRLCVVRHASGCYSQPPGVAPLPRRAGIAGRRISRMACQPLIFKDIEVPEHLGKTKKEL
jgi:hypothetical protein